MGTLHPANPIHLQDFQPACAEENDDGCLTFLQPRVKYSDV